MSASLKYWGAPLPGWALMWFDLEFIHERCVRLKIDAPHASNSCWPPKCGELELDASKAPQHVVIPCSTSTRK